MDATTIATTEPRGAARSFGATEAQRHLERALARRAAAERECDWAFEAYQAAMDAARAERKAGQPTEGSAWAVRAGRAGYDAALDRRQAMALRVEAARKALAREVRN